jgi:hypothetical protein|eukprot:COSAG02_NODE_186_length_30414_cov_24.815372_9_plen_82_part_00
MIDAVSTLDADALVILLHCYRYEMRMTTPAACDESLLRVRYGPDGPVAGGNLEGLDSDTAPDGGDTTASDVDAQGKSKQEL